MCKSGCLGTLSSEHVLHLGAALACAFIGTVGVGALMDLPSHDKLHDDFSEPILDAGTVIIRPRVSGC